MLHWLERISLQFPRSFSLRLFASGVHVCVAVIIRHAPLVRAHFTPIPSFILSSFICQWSSCAWLSLSGMLHWLERISLQFPRSFSLRLFASGVHVHGQVDETVGVA